MCDSGYAVPGAVDNGVKFAGCSCLYIEGNFVNKQLHPSQFGFIGGFCEGCLLITCHSDEKNN